MSLLVAVEALDTRSVGILNFVLGARLADVTHLIAVHALGNSAVDRLASIKKTFKVLLRSSRPNLLLLGTLMLGRVTVGDSELLSQVALNVHVGVSLLELLLISDEVEIDALGTESRLQVSVSNIWGCFDVLSNGLLHVIHVIVLRGSLKLSPSVFSSNIGDMGSINLARVGAFNGRMTWVDVSKCGEWKEVSWLPSSAQFLQTLGGALGQSAAR